MAHSVSTKKLIEVFPRMNRNGKSMSKDREERTQRRECDDKVVEKWLESKRKNEKFTWKIDFHISSRSISFRVECWLRLSNKTERERALKMKREREQEKGREKGERK